MKYARLSLVIIGIFHSMEATVIKTFRNDIDKKVRITIWYQRYDECGKTKRVEQRMHHYSTYVKPREFKRITLRPKKHDGIKACYLMVTNTRRRNEWDAVLYDNLQKLDDFTIIYNKENKLTLSPISKHG